MTISSILLDANVAGWNDLGAIALKGVILAILIVIIGFSWIEHVSKKRGNSHGWLWEGIESNLQWLFVFAWGFNFLVYFIGSFNAGNDGYATLKMLGSVVPMSIIYATESFVGASDISAIYNYWHDSWKYMMCFDLSHLFSVTVSLCFVIKHVGYYAVSKWRYFKETIGHRSEKYSNIYLFWGVNKVTYTLAESTVNAMKGNALKKDYLIIFVKTPLEDNEDDQRIGIDRLLNFVSMKEMEMSKLEMLDNSIVVTSYHKLSSVHVENDTAKADILGKGLKMISLKKILRRAIGRIHIFFFDEDQEDNINSTTNILKDETLKAKQLEIYCLARKNSKTGWMTHYGILHEEEHTNIHVVDSSSLAIYYLKMNGKYHPVNYVQWNTQTAIPTTELSSLVIGFNETGIEALSFLYEFGSFVSDGKLLEQSDIEARRKKILAEFDDDKEKKQKALKALENYAKEGVYLTGVHRMSGEYVAMDANMDSLCASFYSKRPALQGNKEIKFIQCSVGDNAYWHQIEEMLPRLNYVVIAIGDDDKGINTAVDICRMAYASFERTKEQKLSVFVKCYNPDNAEHMEKIAKDLNDLCNEKKESESKGDNNETEDNSQNNIEIVIFGKPKDLFTYDMIINDRIMCEAKKYNYVYSKSTATDINNISDEELNDEWEKGVGIQEKIENEENKEIEYKHISKSTANLSKIIEIERKTEQNICNSLHALTKMRIYELCDMSEHDKTLNTRMAQLEHERWVAYSKMHGWQRMTLAKLKEIPELNQKKEVNEVTLNSFTKIPHFKLHTDICQWDEVRNWQRGLPEATWNYDFKVWSTTLSLQKRSKE